MPTYDYKCKDCGHVFELFQTMFEEPVSICPVCKGKVRRLVSGGAGLIFKGSGFYSTDYKNNLEENKAKPADKTDKDSKPPKTEKKENK